ncbi:hypothetical protein LCGC14_0557800 [marine sediment metagenome]|uniref:HNH nuclease domain-containing protein n=1 Tax=marine sediment metagenome TaxID=412755 RepID=A0A0F9S6K7_9ZZZZ
MKQRLSKVCEHCGKPYQQGPTESSRSFKQRRRFCSRQCRGAASAKPLFSKLCIVCGKLFTRERNVGKARFAGYQYCSSACRKAETVRRVLKEEQRSHLTEAARKTLVDNGYYSTACEICSFNRCYDLAHIVRPGDGGTMEAFNVLTLCPNHHRLFDQGALTKFEYAQIRNKVDIAQARFKEQQA